MENLTALRNLRELWLGKNKIEKIQGLECLPNLRLLDVQVSFAWKKYICFCTVLLIDDIYWDMQSNRICEIENINHLENLEELYIGSNGITEIKGLQNLVSLNEWRLFVWW